MSDNVMPFPPLPASRPRRKPAKDAAKAAGGPAALLARKVAALALVGLGTPDQGVQTIVREEAGEAMAQLVAVPGGTGPEIAAKLALVARDAAERVMLHRGDAEGGLLAALAAALAGLVRMPGQDGARTPLFLAEMDLAEAVEHIAGRGIKPGDPDGNAWRLALTVSALADLVLLRTGRLVVPAFPPGGGV